MKKRYLPLLLLCSMLAFGALFGCNNTTPPGPDDGKKPGIDTPQPPDGEVTETAVTYVFVNGDEKLSYERTQEVGSALTYTHTLISYTDSWYSDEALTTPVETAEGEKMTVYTSFSDIAVRCIFRTADSSQSQNVSATKRAGIKLIDGFTIEGYEFLGWTNGGNTYAAGETVSLENVDPDMPFIFVASMQVKTFAVTYKSEGQADETVTQEYGSAVKAAPERLGYKFVCWMDEKGNPVETVNGPCTLTAKWEIVTYSVTVYSYAADGTEQSTTSTYNYNDTITLNPAERKGYEFSHWTISVDGGEAEVVNGTTYVFGTHYDAESIVFRPVFTGTVRKVTLVGASVGSVDILVGSNIYEALKEAEGDNFSGWFYNAALTKPVGPNDELEYFEVGESFTIYRSTGKTYAVTFIADGKETVKQYPFNTSFLPADNGVKTGHTFIGWFTAAQGGEEVKGVFASPITVYAHFEINSYTVTFDAEGGSNPPAPITKEYGSEIVVPAAGGMTALYATFLHWKDANGKVYNVGDKFTLEADIVLHAVWDRIQITVHLTDWDGYEIYTQVFGAGEKFQYNREALALWLGLAEFDGFTYRDNLFGYSYELKEGTVLTDEVIDITATAYYVNRYTNSVLYTETAAEIMKNFLYFERTDGANAGTYIVSGKPGVTGLTGNKLTKTFRTGVNALAKDFALPVTYRGRLVTGIPDSDVATNGAFAISNANNNNAGNTAYDPAPYSIETLYIPSHYNVIGAYAFGGQTHHTAYFGRDSKLTVLSESNGITARADVVIGFPRGITTIYANGFAGKSKIGDDEAFKVYDDDMNRIRELPSSFRTIYRSAFNGNYIFEKVDLSNVTYLGIQVFNGNANIKEVVIGKKLTTLPSGIFWRCTGITSVTIPAQLQLIDSNAFSACTNLVELNFEANSKLKTIGGDAFWRTGLTDVKIPEGVETIEKGAFGYNHTYEDSNMTGIGFDDGYSPLTKITLPSTLKTIGDWAFACTLIDHIDFPASLREIGIGAFYDTPNLKKIELNEGLRLISNGAFRKKKNYEYSEKDMFVLNIPSTVEFINGSYHAGAFESFFNVTGITFATNSEGKSALRQIKAYAFADLRNLTGSIVFPEGLGYIDAYIFPMQAPATGFYDDDLAGPKVTSITIPSTVHEIGYEAFKNFENLTELKFVDNLGTVDNLNSKQMSNSIVEVEETVPAYLKILGAAFRGATALESVEFPCHLTSLFYGNGRPNLEGEYDGQFYGCTNLQTITFRGRTDGKADIAASISAVSFELCPNISEFNILRNTRIEVAAVGLADQDTFFLRSVAKKNRVNVYCNDRVWYSSAPGWGQLKINGPKG